MLIEGYSNKLLFFGGLIFANLYQKNIKLTIMMSFRLIQHFPKVTVYVHYFIMSNM